MTGDHKHLVKSHRKTKRQLNRRLGLNSWVTIRKSPVTEGNWKKGLQYARQNKDWILEQSEMVMWFDESRVTLFQSNECVMEEGQCIKRLWRLMIWGCSTRSGFS